MSNHWDCPICGEGYPSIPHDIPPDGAIVLVMKTDLEKLKPHLPPHAIIHHVVDSA